jgi:serine/threonine protein kinase
MHDAETTCTAMAVSGDTDTKCNSTTDDRGAVVEAVRYHQYELLRREDGSPWELGRGAMGITYKAQDITLHRAVALKVINSNYLGSERAQERFLREARAAAALRHENIASVYYLGRADERYFYTMEFVDGETIDAYVKRKGPMSPAQALTVARQVASALVAADKEQLVHRDLKPSNLMISGDEDGEQVIKVIDFGLARNLKAEGEDAAFLTKPGEFVGTPQFASPEQVEQGEVDIRSDIYSLGVTLYFMLTGRPPFSGSTGQIASQQLYAALPTELLANIPEGVVKLIRRMTEKDREARPPTPRDLEKQIMACIELLQAPGGNAVSGADDGHNSAKMSYPKGEADAVFLDTYRVVEQLDELPEGKRFVAEDIRQEHRVRLLVLSPRFLSDAVRFAALEAAVNEAREKPHPTLRTIYRLQRTVDYALLVEEYAQGPTLRDILRKRSFLSAPEVAPLLVFLAPLADHAQRSRLKQVDFSLAGIQLTIPENPDESAALLSPLTPLEAPQLKVNGIAFSALMPSAQSYTGSATLVTGSPDEGPRSGYVRLLSLLGYELLGGQRLKLETTGRFTPLAALSENGNAVLRRGIVDEFSSAVEMAEELAASVTAETVSQPQTVSFSRLTSSPSDPVAVQSRLEISAPSAPALVPAKRNNHQARRRWKLAAASIAFCALGWCLSYYAVVGKRLSGSVTTERQLKVADQSAVNKAPPARPAPPAALAGSGDAEPSRSAPAITERQQMVADQPTVKGAQPAPAAAIAGTGNAEPSPSAPVVPEASHEQPVPVPATELSPTPQASAQAEPGSDAPSGSPEIQASNPQTDVSPATPDDTPATEEPDSSTVVTRQESSKTARSNLGHSSESKTKHLKHAAPSSGHSGGFWQNIRKLFPGHRETPVRGETGP